MEPLLKLLKNEKSSKIETNATLEYCKKAKKENEECMKFLSLREKKYEEPIKKNIEMNYENIVKHFLETILKREGRQFYENWFEILFNLITKAISKLSPSFRDLRDSLDINDYIKIKTINCRDQSQCRLIDGYVLTKNVASKKMQLPLENPKILLFDCALDFNKTVDPFKINDFNKFTEQEPIFVENLRKKIDALEANLICTLIIEIFLNSAKKNNVDEFRQMIREKSKYLMEGNIIYPLLISYGKMEEFVEFSSVMGDQENAILYYINEGKIDLALEKLTEFTAYAYDKKVLEDLKEIFVNNSHIFFKKNPKESISLLRQVFKNVKMEAIVQAIISTTDKDSDSYTDLKNVDKNNNLEISQKEENSQAILSYLKSLVEKSKIDEKNNIHNLYIYYLSKNKANQEAIIEYLKGPLKYEENQYDIGLNTKKEVFFQLDYAKKLFKDNPPAYSLVLALMGKYSEGVRNALSHKTPECLKIAKFIASNAPGEKLRKQLWIDIFSSDSQSEFQEALKIMKESKILKIEDVLPHITDTIKIEEFKKQISTCIDDYEKNIQTLKKDISEYNNTAENIKNDIIKIKKKSMEIQYSSCKCDICQGYIKDKNIFLFPCGHMFDAKCIRQCLLDYEATGLEYIHDKNRRIDDLFFELGLIKQKSYSNVNNPNKIIEKEDEEKKLEEQNKSSNIFNKLKFNIDIPGFKKQEISEEKIVGDPKKLTDQLNSILSEQCVLCGDYMVDSVQCSICQPETINPHNDGYKMRLKINSSWDFID